jgi:hypothetical protein
MTQRPLARNEGSVIFPARRRQTAARFTAALSALSLLLALFGIAAPSAAYAKPMSTSFQDAIAASETIAIVRLVELPPEVDRNVSLRPKATLDVVQVLKGKLKLGKQQVGFEDYPSGAPGEFIAFLDTNRVWRFTARPLPGKKVDSDVLEMEGFYDTNRHFVFPGLVTLEQLKTYLKDGTLRYSIEGPIWFPQRHNPAWKASGIRIKLTYDVFKKQVRVTGLPKLAGFPAEPTIWIEYDGRERLVNLDYSRRSDRPLEFLGWVESLDPKSGSLLARFVVKAPNALDADTLQKYLADPQLGHCYYKFRLHCARSQQYPKLSDLLLTLDRDDGPFNTLEGWDGSLLEIIGSMYAGPGFYQGLLPQQVPAVVGEAFAAQDCVLRMLVRTKTNQYLMLAFDIGKPREGPDIFHWTFKNELLYDAYSAPVRGTLLSHDGKTWHRVTTFTVDLDPVAFGSPSVN